MIPKIIHYCWFGRGEMPKLMKKCMKSWRKLCPDWQIIQWNEDNFDVDSTLWTKQAYEARKFAFVSDYVRLKALYEMGGVYLDTDIELKKPLTPYLEHQAFVGFENDTSVATCVIGAQASHPVIKAWLDTYTGKSYRVDGKDNTVPNVVMVTNDLCARGLVIDNTRQSVDGVEVYPQTWFCPQNHEGENRKKSKNTVSIHHFTSTWRTAKGRRDLKRAKFHATPFYKTLEWLRYLPNRVIRRIFGDNAIDRLKKKLRK